MALEGLKTWLTTQTILSPKTLFSSTPPAEWHFMEVYAGFVIFCLVAGIAFIFLPMHKEIREKLVNLFITNALIGGILFFFRYEQVPLLGMDVLRTIQLLMFVVWSILIVLFIKNGFKENRKADKVQAYKNKYLPEGNRR